MGGVNAEMADRVPRLVALAINEAITISMLDPGSL
jgi:hypothetical protein